MIGVTGGSGFIGGHVVEALVEDGRTPLILDPRAPSGPLAGPLAGPLISCPRIAAPLGDPEALRRFVDQVEGIVHLGGVSRSGPARADPRACVEANVLDSFALLETVASSAGRPWILMASTRAAEGEPNDIYGASKRSMELLARAYAGCHGLRIVCVRLGDVYGSERDHPDKLLPTMLRTAARGEKLRIDAPEARFDFVHVDDVVDLLIRICRECSTREGPGFYGYRCTSGNFVSLGELAELITTIASAPLEATSGSTDGAMHVGMPFASEWIEARAERDFRAYVAQRLAAERRRIAEHERPTTSVG